VSDAAGWVSYHEYRLVLAERDAALASLDRVRALPEQIARLRERYSEANVPSEDLRWDYAARRAALDLAAQTVRAALDGPSEPDVTREVATLAVVHVLDTYDETPLPRKSNVERGERVVNALIAAGLLRAALGRSQ